MDKASFIQRTAWTMAALFWFGMVLYLANDLTASGYRPGDAVTGKFIRVTCIVFATYPVLSGVFGGLIGFGLGCLIRLLWNSKTQD